MSFYLEKLWLNAIFDYDIKKLLERVRMNLVITQNAQLKKYNTLRLQAIAQTLYTPLNMQGVLEALQLAKGKRIVLLGNGSNVLFAKPFYDDSYAFIVTNRLDDLDISDGELVVESGVKLHDLAWFAIDHQIGGYEFCEDIPGTVGGALIMNAGQWEYTIGQYVNWVDVVDIDQQQVIRITPDDQFFSYRHSKFENLNVIIVRAGLTMPPGDYDDIFDRMLEFKRERYKKQPRNYPNAGSVFKRPYKNGESLFVWKLFDDVNIRGHRIGGAMISPKHPGFIINVDHASCDDCNQLIAEAQRRVKEQFDIDLELEWKVID